MKKSFDDSSTIFWDSSYNLKSNLNLWGDGYVPFVEEVIESLSNHTNITVLDLPCGDGRNLIPLATAFPFIIGADSSKKSLTISDQRLKYLKLNNYILLECNVFQTNFVDNQFDIVFCWDLLGHLIEVEKAITELLRVLKPGGTFIGSIFSINDSTRGIEMDKIKNEEYVYVDKFYFKFYTEDDVQKLLNNFDITLVSLKEVTWSEPPHEGYREYVHTHTSWAITLIKN